MSTVSREMINYTEKEMEVIVKRYKKDIEEERARQVAKDITRLIDWDNTALMHKGLSWIAKSYMMKANII